MSRVVTIDRRGTMTLPKAMRGRLGIAEEGGVLVAEETADGVLLRAATVVPTRLYTESEIAGFRAADEELRDLLPLLERHRRSP